MNGTLDARVASFVLAVCGSFFAACASAPTPEPATVPAEARRVPAARPESLPVPPPKAAELAVPAERHAVDLLRAALIHVQPFDHARGLIWIDCAAAIQLDDAALAALLDPVKEHVAHLGLARTRTGAKTLAVAASMPNLERLDLRGTSIDTRALAVLGAHPKLATLVVAQTKLDASAVDAIAKLPALVELHGWRSGLDAAALARLKTLRPALRVDSAAAGPAQPAETEPAVQFVSGRVSTPSAPPPTAQGSPATVVNTVCPVTGTAVNAAYTIVFEGRVVGFCCPNCPAKFWAEPESYRSKLPR